MKFLQKTLHLTLIVSIFLAPMDLSWAMDKGEFEDETPTSSQVRKPPAKKTRQKGEEKEQILNEDEVISFVASAGDDEDEGDYLC